MRPALSQFIFVVKVSPGTLVRRQDKPICASANADYINEATATAAAPNIATRYVRAIERLTLVFMMVSVRYLKVDVDWGGGWFPAKAGDQLSRT
jgi:hypothetical protein